MMAALTFVAPLMGAAAKKSNGNPTLLIFAAIAAAFYFLIYRPQARKSKAAKAQNNAFDVGDEVLTAGGIVGHVIDIEGDRVTLETSVGASFVVLRQYVLRRLEPPVDEVEDDSEFDEDEHEEDAEHEGHEELEDHGEHEDHEGAATEHEVDDPDQVEQTPSGSPPQGRTRRRGKRNDGDEQSDPDGPPII